MAGAIIAGGGPVGLTLALELAKRQVHSILLEARTAEAPGSRAICISRRSMDILDGVDCGEPIRQKGLGWTEGTSYWRQHPVYRLRMPMPPGEKHFPMTNLQQFHVERFLLQRVQAEPLIDYRPGRAVEEVTQDGALVRVSARAASGSEAFEAPFLVACDGARSRVREALDLPLSGKSHNGRYLIADIEMRSDYPTERRAWFDPPSNPGATVLMHKQPDDIWRIDYQLSEDQDGARELEEPRVRERIAQHLAFIGERASWRLVWRSLYRAHCLALADYRKGRVFFAGDAAHLVPIFGVRGLNSGFADANNLGWKLAAHLAGRAGPALLDTYNLERRAATLDILAQAEKSTLFMTPPSAGARLLRDAVLSLSVSQDFARPLIDPRQSAPYDYVDSPLGSFAGGPQDQAPPRVGAALPNLALMGRPGAHLLDLLGPDFTAIAFDDLAFSDLPGAMPPELRLLRLGHGEAEIARRLNAAPGLALLVRPDGHVAARLSRPSKSVLLTALWRGLGHGADKADAA